MALLRFLHPPSTALFRAEQPLSLNPTPLPTISSYSISFSWSLPSLSPLSHAHTSTLSVKAKRVSNIVLHFSSTAQEQALDSSSANVSAESQELEPQVEELSRARLIAQNVPWTCTTEDIRALFEKHGTVLDVEVFIFTLLLFLYFKRFIICSLCWVMVFVCLSDLGLWYFAGG
jgi:hypothetical protein